MVAGNPTNNVSARRRGDPPPAAACTRPRPHLLHPLRRRGRSVSPVPPASSSPAVLSRPARQVIPCCGACAGTALPPGAASRGACVFFLWEDFRNDRPRRASPRRGGGASPRRGGGQCASEVSCGCASVDACAAHTSDARSDGAAMSKLQRNRDARPRAHPKITPMSRHRGVLCAVADRAMFPAPPVPSVSPRPLTASRVAPGGAHITYIVCDDVIVAWPLAL